MTWLLTVWIAFTAAAAIADEPQPDKELTAIRAARMIDGTSDELVEPGVALVQEGRIVKAGPDVEVPDEAEVIDLGDATLLPGLIDLHTHLTDAVDMHWEETLVSSTPPDAALHGAKNAKATLMAGFTTARDMGPTWPYVDVALRDAIDNAVVPGPRLQVAGNYVSGTGGAGDAQQFSTYVEVPHVKNLADGPDEIRKTVRKNFKHGADFVKILATGAVMSQGIPPGAQLYTDEELEAAVEEAKRWGRPVACHAHGTKGIKTAIRAGVTTIDHGSMLDDEAVEMIAERPGVYYVPTLYVAEAELNDDSVLELPPGQEKRSQKMDKYRNRSFQKALEAGLTIPFSTDAGVFPHGHNAREFAVRVRLGEPPMESIQAATSVAAKVLGWSDKVGSVSKGHYADLIAVSGNPLEDITELERVKWVMKGGKVYKDKLTKKSGEEVSQAE